MYICNSQPVISIIVPVYKTEKYLRRCIDSILAQTFRDFECILVDDGSPDACPPICDGYAKQDTRIIVIHQENEGVSSARNAGLSIATGKYVCFVDSDDSIGKDYLLHLMQGEFDFVISGLSIVSNISSGENIIHNIPKSFESLEINNSGKCIINLEKLNLLNGPYQKRYKLSIIKKINIKFDKELSFGEDTIFVFLYLQYITSIKVVSESDYCYFKNNDSLTHKRHAFFLVIKYLKQIRKLRMDIYNRFNVSNVFIKRDFEINYQQFLFLPIYSLYYTQRDKNERVYILNKLYTDKEIPAKIIIKGNFLKNIGSSILLKINNVYLSDLFYSFIFIILHKIKPSLFKQNFFP